MPGEYGKTGVSCGGLLAGPHDHTCSEDFGEWRPPLTFLKRKIDDHRPGFSLSKVRFQPIPQFEKAAIPALDRDLALRQQSDGIHEHLATVEQDDDLVFGYLLPAAGDAAFTKLNYWDYFTEVAAARMV